MTQDIPLCLQINCLVPLCRPLGVGVEAPRGAFQRDAVPSVALFYWRHPRPVLHLFKSTATAFAHFIALAGGANGDAWRVWRGVVPS